MGKRWTKLIKIKQKITKITSFYLLDLNILKNIDLYN